MPSDNSLNIIVKLKDDASAGLQAISQKMQGLGEQVATSATSIGGKVSEIGTSMQSLGKSMSSAGQSLSLGLTLPITALGYSIVDTSTKFQASMELIRTQAGASQSEVDSMTQSVLALAKSGETGQGPEKLADGLYHLESLGLRGSQAMDALKVSAQAADLGIADMEGVTNALGAAMVTGIKGTQNMSEAMGLLDATIGQGNMRMDDLVAALGTGVLPAAKSFGLGLQDVGAALATLTDNGMRADESATRLRMTFTLMAAPTDKAKGAFATLGLSAYQLADDMRNGGIVPAMEDLNKHLKASGLSATQQAAVLSEAFGGGRTSAAILTLSQQVDRLKTKYDAIGASAGEFNDKVAATHETNMYKLNAAMAQVQSTMIDLGGTVMPLVAQGLQTLVPILQRAVAWWDSLSPGMQKFVAISLAALAVLGPILVILGSLITSVGVLAGVLGPVITVIGGLGAASVGASAGLSGLVVAAGPLLLVLATITAATVGVTNAFNAMQDAATGAITSSSNLQSTAEKLEPVIQNANGAEKTRLQSLQFSALQTAETTKDIGQRYTGLSGAGNAITDWLGMTHAPSFDNGGVVPGTPTQAVPIIAHGGERIVQASKADQKDGDVHLHFNFNNAVAGDDGIKKIITQTVATINRQSALGQFAGNR